jgi:hypothetical protein
VDQSPPVPEGFFYFFAEEKTSSQTNDGIFNMMNNLHNISLDKVSVLRRPRQRICAMDFKTRKTLGSLYLCERSNKNSKKVKQPVEELVRFAF